MPGQVYPSIRIALAVALVLMSAGACLGGNCTNLGSYRIAASDGRFVFATNGISGTLSTAANGQIQPTSTNATFTASHVIERYRNITDYGKINCDVPTGLHDPLEPISARGTPYAPILQVIQLDQLDCKVETRSQVRQGVNIEGIYVEFMNTSQSDFRFYLNFEVSDATLFEYPNNDTTHTRGEIYAYKWIANKLKITIEVENIPWIGPVNGPHGASFISLHFSLDMEAVSSNFSFCDAKTTQLTLNATDGTQNFEAEWEKFFMLDGTPYFTSDVQNPCVPGQLEGLSFVPFKIGIPLCDDDDYGHYNGLIYDPTLAAGFNLDDPTIPIEQNTPQAKSKRNVVIAASVTSVLVFAALATFVILIVFVPAVKHALIPSSKPLTRPGGAKGPAQPAASRAPNTGSSSSSTSKEVSSASAAPAQATSSWTSGSKPAQ